MASHTNRSNVLSEWLVECQKQIKHTLQHKHLSTPTDSDTNPVSEFLKYLFQKRKEYHRRAIRQSKDSDSDSDLPPAEDVSFTLHDVDIHFLAILIDAIESSVIHEQYEMAEAVRFAVGNWEKRYTPNKWKLSQILQTKMFQELIVAGNASAVSRMYVSELKPIETEKKEFVNDILLHNLSCEIDFNMVLLAFDHGTNAFEKAIYIIENHYLKGKHNPRLYPHLHRPGVVYHHTTYKSSPERALRLAAMIICKEGTVRQGQPSVASTSKPSTTPTPAATEEKENEKETTTTPTNQEIVEGFLFTDKDLLYIYKHISPSSASLKSILQKSKTKMATQNADGTWSVSSQTIADFLGTAIT